MNIARIIQPGESGIDPNWFEPEDESFAGQVESWVMELSYHSAGAPVVKSSHDIVRESYASGKRYRKL